MISDKLVSLRPLIESSKGVHLTIYLVNRGDLLDLKRQLGVAIEQARDHLSSAMTTEDQNKFLDPLESLMKDGRLLGTMKENIGLFRTQDSFRALSLPVPVEPSCIVATTFHVKPLLRWMQSDREFLLLGLEDGAAHLYLGSQSSLRKIDTAFYGRHGLEGPGPRNPLSWVNDWLYEVTGKYKPRLFVAGAKELTGPLHARLRYPNSPRVPIWPSFHENAIGEIASAIRGHLKIEVSRKLEEALMEFRLAEDLNLTRKNVFQIAKAAIQGRVRKLIIADGVEIFGKIDPKSGGLALHPRALDHEDDDILDDLAQTVLSQGGDVIVAPRDEIPKARPIMAILDWDREDFHQGATEHLEPLQKAESV